MSAELEHALIHVCESLIRVLRQVEHILDQAATAQLVYDETTKQKEARKNA